MGVPFVSQSGVFQDVAADVSEGDIKIPAA
jgi:hypothetical protein